VKAEWEDPETGETRVVYFQLVRGSTVRIVADMKEEPASRFQSQSLRKVQAPLVTRDAGHLQSGVAVDAVGGVLKFSSTGVEVSPTGNAGHAIISGSGGSENSSSSSSSSSSDLEDIIVIPSRRGVSWNRDVVTEVGLPLSQRHNISSDCEGSSSSSSSSSSFDAVRAVNAYEISSSSGSSDSDERPNSTNATTTAAATTTITTSASEVIMLDGGVVLLPAAGRGERGGGKFVVLFLSDSSSSSSDGM
jgi:hypothetical protein